MQSNHAIYSSLILLSLAAGAALPAERNRITGAVDNHRRVALKGHVNPKAQAGEDEGAVDPSTSIPSVTLVLKPSDAQQADLDQFLAAQQDPTSPDYHHWLTPDEYAARFGASQDDIDKIAAWLRDQRLTVTGVGRGRNWIAARGEATDVEKAFGTPIHHYRFNGKLHFANSAEPTIPAAFQAVIGTIHGLSDFRMKPFKRKATVIPNTLDPQFTSTKGTHYLAPDDFATIYNVKPLYSSGITGAGQKIAVVGQTQVDLSDLQQFRAYFNLPGSDPQMLLVPNTKDPGKISDDMEEADLDLEWAGAVARNASLVYVYAADVTDAVQYVIDQNLAPIVTMSYGSCEALSSRSDALTLQALARQANAQGITWFAPSGDSGGTDCATGTSSRNASVLSVDMPASIPEVTGVGGTTFSEGSGTYWSDTSDANRGSVLSYIPESAWNDSTVDSGPSATGGGASVYFSKPAWQAGAGVPNDGARDVPDISLAASAEHDGYLIYTGGKLAVIGGTSVGAPTFAGIAALANHYLIANGIQSAPGLGNINPKLYSLAQTTPSAFHDVTAGNNIIDVTCTVRSRNCTAGSFGYSAATGYDQVTGLGSIDTYGLVTAWPKVKGAASLGTASLTVAASIPRVTTTDNVTLTATVKSGNGGAPTGTVAFSFGATLLGTAPLVGAGPGTSTATLTVNAGLLAPGAAAITALYSGDASYDTATGSATVTVTLAGSGTPAVAGLANGAAFTRSYAPGMLLSVFGTQLAPSTLSAASVPLPRQLAGVSATVNGIAAPLYYVSPAQVNLQIPYETAANTTAILTLNNNGRSTTMSIPVAPAAPGIFTGAGGALVPSATAARGQTITLYLTGTGALTPALATGAAPASTTAAGSLPVPAQNVTVTVNGITAPVQFAGNPAGLVGVTQVNFQVPANAPIGADTVVVSVGGVTTPPATLQITQ